MRDETERATRLASTSSTTDTMNISFTILRKVVVDDDINIGNIKTTSGDVSSDKDVARASAELVEGSKTGGLRKLAMQGKGGEA